MTEAVRIATCPCGQLCVEVAGDPVRISVCHCLNCKRRSGSAFAAQARWADDSVTITGESRLYRHTGDSGGVGTFRFCPTCGTTVSYVIDSMPGVTAVAIGTFADPDFPAPEYSVYENRQHKWVAILGDNVEHM